MTVTPTEIDLRGKSLEEVLTTLQANGFKVHASRTSMWDAHYTGPGKPPPVDVVWLADDESPNLTVTIFNGKRIVLEAGKDLHLFHEPDGPAWGAVGSLNVMR